MVPKQTWSRRYQGLPAAVCVKHTEFIAGKQFALCHILLAPSIGTVQPESAIPRTWIFCTGKLWQLLAESSPRLDNSSGYITKLKYFTESRLDSNSTRRITSTEVDGTHLDALESANSTQLQATELGKIAALFPILCLNASVPDSLQTQQENWATTMHHKNPNAAHSLTSSLIWVNHQTILKNSSSQDGFLKGIFLLFPQIA